MGSLVLIANLSKWIFMVLPEDIEQVSQKMGAKLRSLIATIKVKPIQSTVIKSVSNKTLHMILYE